MSISYRPIPDSRDAWLNLVCEGEVASMSVSSAFGLREGDEYIELGQLARGVQRALGAVPLAASTADRILPRKAVPTAVWARLLAVLDEFRALHTP